MFTSGSLVRRLDAVLVGLVRVRVGDGLPWVLGVELLGVGWVLVQGLHVRCGTLSWLRRRWMAA